MAAKTWPILKTGQLIKTLNGCEPRTISYLKEANSQTFKTGDLVYSNSGAITVCGANPSTILGIAKCDATNVTSGNKIIPVTCLNNDWTLFSMQIYHATAASATYSDMTKIAAVTYTDIVQNAAGKWMLDIATNSNARMCVVEYPVQSEALGDIYLTVMVNVLSAVRQVL